jgi:Fe-S-cluster containining protein
VLNYLKEQAKYDAGTIFDFWRLPKEKSACVFLKDDLCTVYAKRPSGCRTLQVTSDPAKCGKDQSIHEGVWQFSARWRFLDAFSFIPNFVEINKKIVVSAEVIASAALALPKTEYEPMPILLLKKYEEFKKNNTFS